MTILWVIIKWYWRLQMNSNSHFLYWYSNIQNVNPYEIKWHISDFNYVGAILNMHIFLIIVKFSSFNRLYGSKHVLGVRILNRVTILQMQIIFKKGYPSHHVTPTHLISRVFMPINSSLRLHYLKIFQPTNTTKLQFSIFHGFLHHFLRKIISNLNFFIYKN
jgi:hypothetical protein